MSRGALTLVALPLLLAGCSRNAEIVTTPGGPAAVIVSDAGAVETSPAEKRSTAKTLGIPPGHLPPPGHCRVWMPGRPPGHQGPSGPCASLQRRVPAGGWLVYRPSENKKHVKVWAYDSGSSSVVWVRWFDAVTGAFLREDRS